MVKINIFNYNKSGNNEKKDKFQKTIKKIGMLILKKLAIILLPAAIIMLIISAVTWFLFQDEGTWDENEKGNPSTYTKGANVSGNDGITVDKNDLVKKNLLNMGYTEEEIANFTDEDIIRIFRIKDKLGKTVTSLDELTHAELLWCLNNVYARYLKKVEDLEYLLNAELVTQYPKIDNLSEDKLNGIVTFERYQVDPDTQVETVKTLKYISNDEFTSLFESYEQSGKKDIFDYFTLDDSGNVKIATWTREEGKYNSNNTTSQNDRKKIRNGVTAEDIVGIDERYAVQSNNADTINASYTSYYISEQLINYKSMIQQYTLPFEYLWSLLVMGDSSDFVLKLAELAYNSEIKIGVYDNIVKTIETNTEKYTEQFREQYKYFEDVSLVKKEPTGTEWKEEEHDYEIVNTITTYTDNVQVVVMYANTWAVEMTANYTNTVSNEDGYENETSEDDEEWDTSDSTYDSWTESYVREDGTNGKYRCEEYYNIQKRTINKSKISKLETINSTYQKEPSTIKEKTDTDPNTDMNFVKLFKDDYNVRTNFSNPSTVNWLISILEKNSDTNNMIDLTKYLIYKATGHDYGVTSYDFNEYDTRSFISIDGEYGDWNGTGSTEDFIKAVAPYAVIDMQQHDIYASVTIAQAIIESGWGKDSIAIKYKNFFGMKAFNKSAPNEYWSGEKVSLNASEGGKDYFRVYDSLKNSIYDHGRNFHVTATYGKHGVLDCILQNLGPKEQLRRIAVSGYAVYRDGSISKPDGKRTYDVYLYEEFIKKYNLEQYDQMSPDDFTQIDNDIISTAKSKLGCPYVYGAEGPDSFDCSGLVYWTYKELGITVPRSTAGYISYISTNQISWDQVQPGDIVWRSGHMGIYIGNDQYIHAPHTGDVVKIASGARQSFTRVFRFSK